LAASAGNDCFVEGAAYAEEMLTSSFLAHVTIDDGLIKRYFALMAPAVDA
jgi:hypothetical protein